MNQKTVLLLGNANSIFVRDFAEQCIQAGCLVDVISVVPYATLPGVRSQLNVADLTCYGAAKRQWLLFRALRHALQQLAQQGRQYDCIMIHFVHFYWALQLSHLKILSSNVVAVVWGSDFYRVTSKFKLWLQKRIYHAARSIIFTNDSTRQAFQKQYPRFDAARLQHACFGLPVLSHIDRLISQRQHARATWCATLGLNPQKLHILVGYNANLAHQQLWVIAQLQQLPPDMLNAIEWVFPLGYGNPQAKTAIADALSAQPQLHAVLLEQFLSFENAAKLRLLTDVLINIQPTDQFSGSMQESLYAGAQVLTGTWLPYQMLYGLSQQLLLIQDKTELMPQLQTWYTAHVQTSVATHTMSAATTHTITTNAATTNSATTSTTPSVAITADPHAAMKDFIAQSSSWQYNWPVWYALMFKQAVMP